MTETVGATNCVKPGIWVLRLCKPRPAAPRGVTVVAGPMPGTAVATGILADKGTGVTEAEVLVDPLVVGVEVNVDAPSAAMPVAVIEIRLSDPVLFI